MQPNSNTLSLGTDSIGRLLLRYSIPAIIAMASASLFNIIDSVFVGHGVGGNAISGMAITLPIMNICAAFGSMIGCGAAARISLRLGEGNRKAADKTLGNAVMLNLIIGITLSVIILAFLDPILIFFSGDNATEQTLSYARDFMSVIMCGNVITHLYLGMNDMIRASGYPQKAMFIVMTAVAVNICLNPLFIFKFGWGIKGSAMATVIAQFCAFSIACKHFCSKNSFLHFKSGIFGLDKKIILAIISIGMAPFLLNLCSSSVSAFLNSSLLSYGGTYASDAVHGLEGTGDIYVGASGIVNRIILLFVMIVLGLVQGMQPIVGYNYGAKNYARAKKAMFITMGIAFAVTSLGMLMGRFMPYQIAMLFVDQSKGGADLNIVNAAAQGLRIATLLFPIVGIQIVATNFFQHIGKAYLSVATSMTRQLIFLLPLLWLLAPRFGACGVWYSMPIADLTSTLLAIAILVYQLRGMQQK